MSYVNIEDFSIYQTQKQKILCLLLFSTQRLGNSDLSSAVQLPNVQSQTSSMKPFSLPQTHCNTDANTLHRKKLTNSYTHKRTFRANTHDTHTHLFEDPTNLSNSALGVLLMGDRGRGWWKCLRPGRIDRLATPNERQACLRNHEGRAVGLQQRS